MPELTAEARSRPALRYQLDTTPGAADPGGERRQGQGGPGRGPPHPARGVRGGPGPARPDRAAGGAGGHPGARAGAGPLGPDARLPVHLLPRGGPADGQRPGHHAGLRAGGAGVRRRAPVQLRHLRLRRAPPGVRRQRLRRDPARPVGVGCQAAGRQPGGGGPGERVRCQAAARHRHGGGRQLPAGHARLRGTDEPGRLVRAHRCGAVAGRPQCPAHRAAAQEVRPGHRQGADPGQHADGGQATAVSWTASRGSCPTRRCWCRSPI